MSYSELKTLFELLETKERVKNAIESIESDYVSIDEISSGDYFTHDESYYSHEYVMTGSGNAVHIDAACYCEGTGDYWEEKEMVTVYIYRTSYLYNRQYAENFPDWQEYRGDFYDLDALSYHNLVYVEDLEEIRDSDDVYYHESDGLFYSYKDDSCVYTRDYHNGSYKTLKFDGKSKYCIGYEIEKEDYGVLESISIDDFEEETGNLWRKEKDGSLDGDTGYELISPTFEFNIDKIFEHIECNDVLVRHINADKSTSCGGHIHLSEEGLSGEQLFDKVKGYMPLLYALYYGRVDKSYCKGKANDDLKCDNEKYQAVKIHSNRIEFRIISAVPNVSTLKWRSKLLMMMLQNPTHDVIKAYYNVDTKFTKILKQAYSDDKLVDLKERFVKFTRQFEGIDIKNNNNDKK